MKVLSLRVEIAYSQVEHVHVQGFPKGGYLRGGKILNYWGGARTGCNN